VGERTFTGPDLGRLNWPFFGKERREFACALDEWAAGEVDTRIDCDDVNGSCRALLRALGDAGRLRAIVPAAWGGLFEHIDVRGPCLAHEILDWHDSLADFAICHAGIGHRRDLVIRNRCPEGPVFAPGLCRAADCGVWAV
jgi:acyl-CoA dehydrogenase